MEKKGNAANLLIMPFWNSVIIFFNLILVLGGGFCFVSVKSCGKFLKFSGMFKMSACLVFQSYIPGFYNLFYYESVHFS